MTTTDTVKQSQKDGTVKTDEGKKVDATAPAIPHPAPAPEQKAVSLLSVDEQEKLLGELEQGEQGWLPLNEDGTIAGPAKRGTPPHGERAIKVVAVGSRRADVLMTPSGAPLMERMQPDPMATTRPYEARAEEKRKADKKSESK